MSLSRQLRRAAERKARKEEVRNQREARVSGFQPESTAEVAAGVEPLATPDPESARKPEPAVQPAAASPRTGAGGPRTPAGKAVSSLNNLKHGLAGAFRVLDCESQSDFDAAHDALIAEHQPATVTECELVRRMAEHAWLSRRAMLFQNQAIDRCDATEMSLFLRYQTTNDRGFRACLTDLFRLRREQRAAQKQFESQNREAELHEARVRLAKSAQGACGPLCANSNARAAHVELDTDIRSTVDAPIPGYSSVPVEQIKELFKTAMLSLKYDKGANAAA